MISQTPDEPNRHSLAGLALPPLHPESLVGASEDRLEGLANGIKGKYFEVLVEGRLNNDESLGELILGPGQVARIAESPTQEGWDLEILNTNDGSVVEVLQLKATTSMSYVKRALTDVVAFNCWTFTLFDHWLIHTQQKIGRHSPNWPDATNIGESKKSLTSLRSQLMSPLIQY